MDRARREEAGMLVAVRIRPLSKKELTAGIQSCCQTLGSQTIAIRKGGDANGYLKSQQSVLSEYAFDCVFGENSTQEEVYRNTAKKFIPNFVNGKNVTVFAYGATGAGKTHTMLGDTRADSSAQDAGPGIIPCAVRDIFELIEQRQASGSGRKVAEKWTVSLGYIEVYNEQVFDLLGTSGKVLSVREDQERGIVVVAGMQEQEVSSYDEVMEYMMQGNRNRKTEATMANAVSSRSHAVLQLTLRRSIVHHDTNRESMVESKLSLIDLAGSERASATNNRGVRLQEGASINKSLLALANCINALSENAGSDKKSNVKFRDSKLTHLLKSSLEGNCNLIMIANINPSDTTYEDSHNTLKYANRAKNIKVNPTVQETAKDTNWLDRELRLRNENAALRARVDDLTRGIAEFRSTLLVMIARGATAEELAQYVEENGQLAGSSAASYDGNSGDSPCPTDSDTSFNSGETAREDHSSLDGTPTPVVTVQLLEEVSLGRGRRRASMSAIPAKPTLTARATKQTTSAPVTKKAAAAEKEVVAMPTVATAAKAEAEVLLVDSEDDLAAPVAANTRRRRASLLPTPSTSLAAATISALPTATAPVAPAPSQRQTSRRSTMSSKLLSSTIAATRAAVEAAAVTTASATAKVTIPTKTVEPAVSRVTRRKSMVVSPVLPTLAEEDVLASAEKKPAAVSEAPSPATESESVDTSREESVQPMLDEHEDSVPAPPMSAEPVVLRRSGLRRASVGASMAKDSNRRQSLAKVTASIDALAALLPTGPIVPAGRKRGVAMVEEELEVESSSARKTARVEPAEVEVL